MCECPYSLHGYSRQDRFVASKMTKILNVDKFPEQSKGALQVRDVSKARQCTIFIRLYCMSVVDEFHWNI